MKIQITYMSYVQCLLFTDEATSALDTNSEALVQDALDKAKQVDKFICG